MIKHTKPFVLILYNIRSCFNVGAIFRTADAAGITKIFLGGITPAPPHPKIDKVALGAEKSIPFESWRHTKRALKKLKTAGYNIVALEQSKKSISYTKFRPKYPLALLLGSEVKGLPSNLLKECHEIIEIPMYGKKESLNVAIASGITIFEIVNK
ncbi:RNA methyltransferase [Patescibacteria group bacterium]|nr:RNA methyltransferase [Patescibacteria group bacterium]MBU0963975.1 RNA methyltransferase [Patescibacteria group bacterium]